MLPSIETQQQQGTDYTQCIDAAVTNSEAKLRGINDPQSSPPITQPQSAPNLLPHSCDGSKLRQSLQAILPPLCVKDIKDTGVTNAFKPLPDVPHFSTGALTERSYRLLAQKGIKTVIDLLPTQDAPLKNEREVAQTYEIVYLNLPIADANDITFENADKLHELFEQYGHSPLLLHCRSANRNGALKALIAFKIEHKSADDAITIGRKWGLTTHEAIVRSLMV